MSDVHPATPLGSPPLMHGDGPGLQASVSANPGLPAQATVTPGQAAYEARIIARRTRLLCAGEPAAPEPPAWHQAGAEAADWDAAAQAAIDADDYEPGSFAIGPGERVIADIPPAPAPELAAAMAETRQVRDGYARLCQEFGPSAQSGWSARISLTILNRHRGNAGLEALARTESSQREDITMRYRRERDDAQAEITRLRGQLQEAEDERDDLRTDYDSLASDWPKCPDGCGCRLGLGDADRQECGCDGPCAMECRENGYQDAMSYRDLAVKHVMDERDHVVRELRLERDAARRERDAHKLRADHYEGLWRAEHGLPPGSGQDDEPARFQVAEARDTLARWDKTISGDTFGIAETLASHLRGMLAIIDSDAS